MALFLATLVSIFRCIVVVFFCVFVLIPPPNCLRLVYDTSTTSNVVVLNTIHIDIMDYILPATCTDTEFRQMWQDFEWENKVSVNTTITDLHEYLRHLLKSTNMKCLTPEQALSGQCGFMAANMYAR